MQAVGRGEMNTRLSLPFYRIFLDGERFEI